MPSMPPGDPVYRYSSMYVECNKAGCGYAGFRARQPTVCPGCGTDQQDERTLKIDRSMTRPPQKVEPRRSLLDWLLGRS